MATNNSSTGRIKFADDFFIKALYEGRTRSTAGVTIEDQVHQETYKAPTMGGSNFVQTGTTCTWDDGGTSTIGEASVTLGKYYVNKQECYSDYLKNIENEEGVPAKAIDALQKLIIYDITNNGSTGSEVVDWLGKTATPFTGSTGGTYVKAQTNGIIYQLNGVAQEIAGNTLTKANVVSKFEAAMLAAPASIINLSNSSPDQLIFFCSPKAEMLYKQALSSQGINTTDKAYVAYHDGIEIRGVAGLIGAPNVIVFGKRDDFHFVSNTGLDSQTKLSVIDMNDRTNEEVVRAKASYRFGVVVTNPADMVLVGF